jgi:hypothetical protein
VGEWPEFVWEESGFPWIKEGDDSGGGFTPFVPDGVPNPFEEIYVTGCEVIPESFALHGAYPNPFNPTTTLSFALPEAARVTLIIYDITGRQVAELIDGWRDAGMHSAVFDASDLASGVYLCWLEAGGFTNTQKMVMLK